MENQRNSECWYKDVCTDRCFMCRTFLEMRWQMENSGLPVKLRQPIEMYINDVNRVDRPAYVRLKAIKTDIEKFVADGNNLYICGRAGNGKTSWAVRMLHTYFHKRSAGNYERLQGMFVSVSDYLIKLKDFNSPLSKEYKDNLENVPLVVWDDVAITGISQYDYTQLFTAINNRILAGKSNIFTSNIMTENELEKILGERLTSRIYGASEIITLKGGDMR